MKQKMKERLLSEKEPKQIIEKINEKFPIAKCREILEKGGKKFTDEQIIMVRDFLMNISKAAYQIFQKQIQREVDFELEVKSDNIIQLNNKDSEEIEIKNAA